MKNLSHYSLLESSMFPEKIVNKYAEYGYKTCAIIDRNTTGGAVQFIKACKDKNIKPILGCEITLAEGGSAICLAKNLNGWRSLNLIIAESNKQFPIQINKKALLELAQDIILVGAEKEFLNINNYCFYEARYISKEDFNEFKIITCLGRKQKLDQFNLKNEFYIRNWAELKNEFTLKQRENTRRLLDQCEDFDFRRAPQLPIFKCPDNKSSKNYLQYLCDKGKNKIKDWTQIYEDRLNYESSIINEAGLSDYFLIVWDIIKYCNDNGYLTGAGRGSSSGCLISYLLNITQIDPIKYDLIFERFFNKGRIGSLPDIDFDIPKFAREDIINYIVKKYGREYVSSIVTFQTLQGRAAIKETFRVFGDLDFSEINRITKPIEDKAKIADELQEMKNRGEEPSTIMWALQNKAKDLEEWCYLDDNGELKGAFAERFQFAINLEKVKRSQSKHAAGIIISKEPLREVCPMIYDKTSKGLVVGLEMECAESVGLLKLDCLGLETLDRLMSMQTLIRKKISNVNV